MARETRFRRSRVSGAGLGTIDADGVIHPLTAIEGAHAAIADVPTGESADAAENADAINAILAVLRDAKVIQA